MAGRRIVDHLQQAELRRNNGLCDFGRSLQHTTHVQRVADLAGGDRPFVDQVRRILEERTIHILAELDNSQVENICVDGVAERIAGVGDVGKTRGSATESLGCDNQLAPIECLYDVPAGQAVWFPTILDHEQRSAVRCVLPLVVSCLEKRKSC
jgi:hypothetical protein